MIFEYLENGASECPVLRIYDYDDEQIISLQAAVDVLAGGGFVEPFTVSQIAKVIGIQGVSMIINDKDEAELLNDVVIWSGSTDYWKEIAQLICPMHPVSLLRNRFQWISGPMAYYDSTGLPVLLTELNGGQW